MHCCTVNVTLVVTRKCQPSLSMTMPYCHETRNSATRRICANAMTWLTPKTRPCSTCYHSDLGRSRLLVGVPNIWGAPGPRPLSWSVPDTLQSCPSPHGNVTISNLMTVVQMLQTYVWRSARKLGFSRPAFQGHWN